VILPDRLYATAYLNILDDEPPVATPVNTPVLRISFSQPGQSPQFLKRVQQDKVSLQSCLISDTDNSVSGTVRVANISFHKRVKIQYTIDGWKTVQEITCGFIHYASDGVSDQFDFVINLASPLKIGGHLDFCVVYEVGDNDRYWDNNSGQNYRIDCVTMDMIYQEMNSTIYKK